MFPYQKAQVSFKKIEEIGHEGQNSKVYRAHDLNLDTEIVIKEVSKENGFSTEHYFAEARTLYRSAHPNVVQVTYACEDEGKVYVASPFYKNGSLKKLMAQEHLTVKDIIRFSTHLLNGLHNVHSKGLIHFDIKPDNILISNRHEALLADFGLTKIMDENGVAQQDYLYTKQVPPELFGNVKCIFDNRFDIYQAGLTIYRMCVGDNVFDAQYDSYFTNGALDQEKFGRDIIRGNFPDRKAYPLHIPKKLQRVINKCIKPQPVDRYNSAIEVVNAMSDIDGSILHWKYSVGDDFQQWESEVNGVTERILIKDNRKSVAYKKNGDSAERKQRQYCKDNITDNDIIRFLEK